MITTRVYCIAVVGVVFASLLPSPAVAETFRKSYTFPYRAEIRKASETRAIAAARKNLLRDYLAQKLSSELIARIASDIDLALEPPDQFLSSFSVVSTAVSDDQSSITLVVDGSVDLPGMLSALLAHHVISFGEHLPKVMLLPSPRFEDPKSAKALRASLYEKFKQAGLAPVLYQESFVSVNLDIRQGNELNLADRQLLARQAAVYGTDYLIYVDTQADSRPFSQGGYITDAIFTFTITRPNGSLILGEAAVSERGSGNTAMLSFAQALNAAAPQLASACVGQLFQAIYEDSDVIYSTPQRQGEITLIAHDASERLVQAMIDGLEQSGARVSLGVGTGEASRLKVETGMGDTELYRWLNEKTWTLDGKTYRTPVIGYSENIIEVEASLQSAKIKRSRAAPPQPGSIRKLTVARVPIDSLIAQVPRVVMKLRAASITQ